MENIKRSVKMILLYNSWKINLITIITALIIAIPGIVSVEPITSKEYMYSIVLSAFSLIVYVFGSSNNSALLTQKRFILTTIIAKNSHTITNILYTNTLGLIFINVSLTLKYLLSLAKIGNMNNFSDTLFVFVIVLGFISFMKVMQVFFNFISLALLIPLILAVGAMAKYSLVLLEFRMNMLNNNSIILILIGMLFFITINIFSYLLSVYLYKNRKYFNFLNLD